MIYKDIVEGIFIERHNRFVATVKIGDETATVHVKNTGRCKELLIPGCTVYLSVSDNPNRKTKYDLIAVNKAGLGIVNIDSQAPNQVVLEWLKSKEYSFIRPEYKYGNSRLDFYIEDNNKKILMEVKGCTLEVEKIGYFPDAPTERGTKHLNELSKAISEGYECYICFVIQMEGVSEVRTNLLTDSKFAEAYYNAINNGVKVLFLQCCVKPNEIKVVE